MSLKTRILLSRGGRDQFGDVNDDAICYVSTDLSAEEKKEFHDAVAAFFDAQWPAWEQFCHGKTSPANLGCNVSAWETCVFYLGEAASRVGFASRILEVRPGRAPVERAYRDEGNSRSGSR